MVVYGVFFGERGDKYILGVLMFVNVFADILCDVMAGEVFCPVTVTIHYT